MKHLFPYAALLAAALPVSASVRSAYAQTALIDQVQIIERGIYRSTTIKRSAAPNTTGVVNTVEDVQLVTSTTTVFGSVGARFGLRYVATGGPGAEAALKYVIKFPPGGLRNPATGQMIFQSEQSAVVPLGAPLYWEYHLENDWEVVPGLWTFEFWHGMHKVGEQHFCVYELARAGETPKSCDRMPR